MEKLRYELEARVDGNIIPPRNCFCLYQRDPFPGGHAYELTISTPEPKRIFPNIGLDIYHELDSNLCTSVFLSVDALLSKYRIGGEISSVMPGYFLNSVSLLVISGREVRLEGVCSEIQKLNNDGT